jgi:hypothetical protein
VTPQERQRPLIEFSHVLVDRRVLGVFRNLKRVAGMIRCQVTIGSPLAAASLDLPKMNLTGSSRGPGRREGRRAAPQTRRLMIVAFLSEPGPNAPTQLIRRGASCGDVCIQRMYEIPEHLTSDLPVCSTARFRKPGRHLARH